MKDNFKKHILSPKKRFYFIVCVYFRVTLPVWTDTAWARPRQSGRAPASSTTSSGSWRPTSRSTRTPTRGSWRCCPRRPASTRKFCRSVFLWSENSAKEKPKQMWTIFCHQLFFCSARLEVNRRRRGMCAHALSFFFIREMDVSYFLLFCFIFQLDS